MLRNEITSINYYLHKTARAWGVLKERAACASPVDSAMSKLNEIPTEFYEMQLDINLAESIDIGDRLEAKLKAAKERR